MYDLHVPPLNPRVCHLVRHYRKHMFPTTVIEELHRVCVNIKMSLFHSMPSQEISVYYHNI